MGRELPCFSPKRGRAGREHALYLGYTIRGGHIDLWFSGIDEPLSWQASGLAPGDRSPVRRAGQAAPQAILSVERMSWPAPRLLVTGRGTIRRWLELLDATLPTEIGHRDLLSPETQVDLRGFMTATELVRTLAQASGFLALQIDADGRMALRRPRDAGRLVALAADVESPDLASVDPLKAICDLGRARGEDDIPPDVQDWCEALSSRLDTGDISEPPDTGEAAELLALWRHVTEGICLRDARPDSLRLARARLALARQMLRTGQPDEGRDLWLKVQPVLEHAVGHEPDVMLQAEMGEVLYLLDKKDAARKTLASALKTADGLRHPHPREFEKKVMWPLLVLTMDAGDDDATLALANDFGLRMAGHYGPHYAPFHFRTPRPVGERASCRNVLARLLVVQAMGNDRFLPSSFGLPDIAACTFVLGDYATTAGLLGLLSGREGQPDTSTNAFSALLQQAQREPDRDDGLWKAALNHGLWKEWASRGPEGGRHSATWFYAITMDVQEAWAERQAREGLDPVHGLALDEALAVLALYPDRRTIAPMFEHMVEGARKRFSRSMATREQRGEDEAGLAARKASFARIVAGARAIMSGVPADNPEGVP